MTAGARITNIVKYAYDQVAPWGCMAGPMNILLPIMSPVIATKTTNTGRVGATRINCQPIIAAAPPITVDRSNDLPADFVASVAACCPIDATLIMTGAYAVLAPEKRNHSAIGKTISNERKALQRATDKSGGAGSAGFLGACTFDFAAMESGMAACAI